MSTLTAPIGRSDAGRRSERPVTLAIIGVGVVSPVGLGTVALADALRTPPAPRTPQELEPLSAEPLPDIGGHALIEFSAKEHLGRKGTSFMDRSTALALVACREALADAGLAVEDLESERTGVVLGTSAGSVPSTSNFARATYVEDKPYLVNPLVFPNAVMNCAAAQAGIRFALRGPNTTVAGGGTAMASVIRYARTLLSAGRADRLLIGATEEFGPQSAWTTAFRMERDGGSIPCGEGSAVLVVESAAAARAAGHPFDAELVAAELAVHHPRVGVEPDVAIATVIRRALAASGHLPDEVVAVATAGDGTCHDDEESRGIAAVLPGSARRVVVREAIGDAGAASSALQVAGLISLYRRDPRTFRGIAVAVQRTADGAIGVVVLRLGHES